MRCKYLFFTRIYIYVYKYKHLSSCMFMQIMLYIIIFIVQHNIFILSRIIQVSVLVIIFMNETHFHQLTLSVLSAESSCVFNIARIRRHRQVDNPVPRRRRSTLTFVIFDKKSSRSFWCWFRDHLWRGTWWKVQR